MLGNQIWYSISMNFTKFTVLLKQVVFSAVELLSAFVFTKFHMSKAGFLCIHTLMSVYDTVCMTNKQNVQYWQASAVWSFVLPRMHHCTKPQDKQCGRMKIWNRHHGKFKWCFLCSPSFWILRKMAFWTCSFSSSCPWLEMVYP